MRRRARVPRRATCARAILRDVRGVLRSLVVGLGLWIAGCGDDGGHGAADAGGDGGLPLPDASLPFALAAPTAPTAPTLPAEPALPVLGPCPTGWNEESVAGVAACTPPASDGVDCAPYEARFVDAAGCRRVGTACPADGFPELPAEVTSVRYVRAGAPAGGIGTRAAPYATIARALVGVTPGATIALGVGTYPEELELPAGVTLWGACAEQVIVGPSTPDDTFPGVSTIARGVVLKNLTLSTPRVALWIDGGEATVEDVVTRGADATAWVVSNGGEVVARRVVIRDTALDPGAGTGNGIWADFGGQVSLERFVLERNAVHGVLADASSTVRLVNGVIRDTLPRPSDGLSRAVTAVGGATVEVEGVLAERQAYSSFFARGVGTRLTLTGVVVRGQAEVEDDDARGLVVQEGATLEARRTRVTGARSLGAYANGAGSTLVLEDVLVDATEPDLDGSGGRAVELRLGSHASLTRVLASGAYELGVAVMDPGTEATLDDVIVQDVAARSSDGTGGRGIEAMPGTHLSGARVRVERAHELGLAAFGDSTMGAADVSLDDVTIRDIEPSSAGQGRGVSCLGSTETLRRLLVERTTEIGISTALAGTMLVLEDVTVRDTRPSADGLARCLNAQDMASAEVTRMSCERGREIAVAAVDGVTLVLRDLVVRDQEGEATSAGMGYGLIVTQTSHAMLERAVFERTTLAGILASGTGSVLDASDVVIREVRSGPDRTGGRGLGVHFATATVSRLVVEGARESAVLVTGAGATLAANDVVLWDTHGVEATGLAGLGAAVQDGAMLTLSHAFVGRAREAALVAAGDGARLVGESVVVRDVLERDCVTGSCAGEGAGIGATAFERGALTLTDFEIARAALAGVQIARAGEMDLARGEIHDCTFGAAVHDATFDLRRLTTDVVYRNNGRNVASDFAPLPESALPPLPDTVRPADP